MSHYEEAYDKYHESERTRELSANRYRKQLSEQLPIEDMVRIMFTHYLHKCSSGKILELEEKYLKKECEK